MRIFAALNNQINSKGKMKKLQTNLFLMLLAGLFTLVSCNSDDPDFDVNQLHGSWVTTHMKLVSGGIIAVEKNVNPGDEGYSRITFGSDAKFLTEDFDGVNNAWTLSSTGTYKVKGNKVTTTTIDVYDPYAEKEVEEMTVEQLTDDMLVLSANGIFEDDDENLIRAKLTITLRRE